MMLQANVLSHLLIMILQCNRGGRDRKIDNNLKHLIKETYDLNLGAEVVIHCFLDGWKKEKKRNFSMKWQHLHLGHILLSVYCDSFILQGQIAFQFAMQMPGFEEKRMKSHRQVRGCQGKEFLFVSFFMWFPITIPFSSPREYILTMINVSHRGKLLLSFTVFIEVVACVECLSG